MSDRFRLIWKQYQNWILISILVAGMGILYAPTLMSYFISDDFTYLKILFFNWQALLSGQQWYDLLILGHDPRNFRPAGMLFVFLNYAMWGTDAFGYHLTDIILASLCVVLVYLVAIQLFQRQLNATIAALVFAIQPMHPGAVSWMAAACYDVLVAFFCLLSLLFFILYRRAQRVWYYGLSIGTFVLALLTKETTLTFPAALLIYDGLFNFKKPFCLSEWFKTHAPFWIGLGLYMAYRIFGTGTFGYKATSLNLDNAQGWVLGMMNFIGDPWMANLNNELRFLALGILFLLALFYRSRREVLFGLAWIPILFFPVIASVSGPSGRSFYLPSLGVGLVASSILLQPSAQPAKMARVAGIAVLALLVLIDSATLYSRNQTLQRASQVAEAILTQVKQLHPTIDPQERLIFTGVPDRTPDGTLIFITGFGDGLTVKYGIKSLPIFKFTKFPIWLDNLSRTFMFQIDHRQVTPRPDLLSALKARQACSNFIQPATIWDFTNGLQSWEAWNDLNDLAVRDRLLTAHAESNDPILGSPTFDIPSIAIGEVRITMRVRAAVPNLQGNIYWLATDQADFFPGLNKSFTVQADGEWHTYNIDLAQTGALLIGDHVTQLRFDPVDAPAEIAIKNIEITTHCSTTSGQFCNCSP